ncbi:type VI secretion system baseplate subunit TssF [Myxococcus sp. XM-1-1-1]|uniref:type VI secretion system baseplate subunit TssF n=1 Tax=Myxococcus sp. XM-1-1-1 TaxID=2874602 RepID=UPI001CBE06EF|nr:type VI secretion system baseplate subunit TssF [Myxococcus sp. XM-1-1-1]
MFSKYYQSELTYLREMGRAFGTVNPALAGLLVERGGDPDVERLLEGFAFLTARVRERIDGAVPEVIHGLTELLLPHYLRVVPACSVVEFTPHARLLRGRSRIAAGTEVGAKPVDGTVCTFRTTRAVDLLPLTLTETTLDQSSPAAPVLRAQLQLVEQGRAEIFTEEGLSLFLHAELPVASMLLVWLLRHCKGVVLRNPAGGPSVRLGPECIRATGLEAGNSLWPWPATVPEGYRLLQEYFTLPQKFLFIDVKGLQAASELTGQKLELLFEFERPPTLPGRLPKDVFRLHCAPVVNLFAASADPVRTGSLGHEHLVRASGVEPGHMEVYSVDSVTGLPQGRTERQQYRPYFDFAHATGDASRFYRLHHALSPLDDAMDVSLSLGSPRDATPSLADETLSIELTCTNRSLPSRLQVGDLSVPTAASPTTARFRNIVAVTRPSRPPMGSELHWRLLSHLSLNQRSLLEPGALQSMLALYNFQATADQSTARANELRVGALREVRGQPLTRFLQGAPVRGVQVTVELDEAGFTGPGDAFLFGCVLDELFASHVSLNSFSELVLRLQPSRLEYRWLPRNGRQTIC